MIATKMSGPRVIALATVRGSSRRRTLGRAAAAIGVMAAGGIAACSQTNVPYLTAPTSVPNSPIGIQNAVSGLLSASRLDVYGLIIEMGTFSRDAAIVWGDNPQDVTWYAGVVPIPPASSGVWAQEYLNVGQALSILQTLPSASPAYTSAQAAAITGIVQTVEALNLMVVAETRDTLGIPIHAATAGGPGPVYCNPDVWRWIVALLDSANASLNTAGTIQLPIVLPAGFSSVNAQAAPSTVAGSFAAFNRALAGKAGLELAYAIARNSAATHPTPTSPGTPDVAALTRADSALTASALFSPTTLAPPTGGQFSEGASGVFWDFSAQSGDQANPIHANSAGIWDVLKTLVADVDTVNDLRWKAKFGANPFPLQLPAYNYIASEKVYTFYPATSSPVPIIRNEDLVLIHAQIRLGLGDFAGATTAINQVHQGAGGFATPLTIAPTYTAVRDSLLKEQRISTIAEYSSDRTIALRMYHLEAIADTTFGATDLHTTVLPVPAPEVAGRGGSYVVTCSK